MKSNKTIIDITNQFKKSKVYELIVQKGVNNYEIEIATWLLDNLGGNITCLTETPTIGKMPDALWNGMYLEFKTPTTKNAIDNRIHHAQKQLDEANSRINNPKMYKGILLDLSYCQLSKNESIKWIRYYAIRRCTPNTIIIVKNKKNLLKILLIK